MIAMQIRGALLVFLVKNNIQSGKAVNPEFIKMG